MGVFQFYYGWVKKVSNGVNLNKLPPIGVEGVIVDMNGILHAVAQEVFMYGKYISDHPNTYEEDRKAVEGLPHQKFMERYGEVLSHHLNEILMMNPKQYIIFAVDGIAPNAKILQQRFRRYKDIASGGLSPVSPGFNSAMISPGTDFMNTVDAIIKSWISESSEILPPQLHIVYSPHTIPGEGEHKAFGWVRELMKDSSITQSTGCHVVYGMDSDLMMISMLSPLKNIYMYRNKSEVVHIDALFSFIKGLMTTHPETNEYLPSSKFPDEILKIDFSIIVMLVGNDFLPTSLAMSVVNQKMFSAYGSLGHSICVNVESGEISLAALAAYFKAVASSADYLSDAAYEDKVKNTDKAKIASTPAYDESYSVSGNSQSLNFKKLRSEWYTRIGEIKSFTDPNFKNLPLSQFIKNVVTEYIGGIAWVTKYYKIGGEGVNWMWAFKYISAPLPFDVVWYISQQFASGEISSNISVDKWYSSVVNDGGGVTSSDGYGPSRGKPSYGFAHQLLTITPPSRIQSVLGKKYNAISKLILPGGNLEQFAPRSFKLFKDGKAKDYMAIPILPEITFSDINAAIESAEKAAREVSLKKFNCKKGGGGDCFNFNDDMNETNQQYYPKMSKLLPSYLDVGYTTVEMIRKPFLSAPRLRRAR